MRSVRSVISVRIGACNGMIVLVLNSLSINAFVRTFLFVTMSDRNETIATGR